MVFHLSLSDSKSPQVSRIRLNLFKSLQVSRTLLSILADPRNAEVWMVSTRSFISKSSSPFINLLVTVPKAPDMFGIKITFMFHSFSVP